MTAPSPRFFHLTAPKCGSQWVRDVLAAPEITAHSGVSLHPAKVRGEERHWPNPETPTLFAPVYWVSRDSWLQRRQPADKALVVLRDPRDVLVSWVFSTAISHRHTDTTRLLREVLAALSMPNCLRVGMLKLGSHDTYWRSWSARPRNDAEFVTDYRQLVEDPEEFRRIFAFLGWSIPDRVLAQVLHRLSFQVRSGRERGEEDPNSHYRKGTAGDWKNHFDRTVGRIFEMRHPGMLLEMGYEQDPNWAEQLPEVIDPRDREARDLAETRTLTADLARLRERQAEVEGNLEKSQRSISQYREEVRLLKEKIATLSQENKSLKKAASGEASRPAKPAKKRRGALWRGWLGRD